MKQTLLGLLIGSMLGFGIILILTKTDFFAHNGHQAAYPIGAFVRSKLDKQCGIVTMRYYWTNDDEVEYHVRYNKTPFGNDWAESCLEPCSLEDVQKTSQP